MDNELLQHLLDACFYGKQITELMPPLPPKIKPRHIHVINAIHALQEKQKYVRISDISYALRITKPSVTKLINELKAYGAVEKRICEDDKRVVILSLTPLGTKYFILYVKNYHNRLMKILEPLENDDCKATIRTLEKMCRIMKANPIKIEN